MTRALKKVAQWHNVTIEMFDNEIVPLYEPAILKGYVSHWPSVEAGVAGPDVVNQYLSSIYAGGKVRYARLAAEHAGLFGYSQDMRNLNFKRDIVDFEAFMQEVISNIDEAGADTLALQSAPIPDYFPDFASENNIDLFPPDIEPRVWIGNDAIVSAHYDDSENIACVVSGKRRFTLFPPQQIDNLYIGPIDFTPAGAPVSLVDHNNPDFGKFPKYREALNHALVAELEPGDAIYIPSLWWHHVEAYGGLNILVNYWCGGSIEGKTKPVPADNMLLGMLSIRDLPQAQKDAWKAILDYFVFSDQYQKHDHIPEQAKGLLSRLSPKQQSDIRRWLINQLKA